MEEVKSGRRDGAPVPKTMARPLAAPVTTAEPRFVFQFRGTHVEAVASDGRLGMPQLMEAMQQDPKLHNCVIEQCAFDGDAFTATLRVEK